MVTYTYDESGLRTRKYNGSEYTYYDRDASGNLVHETRNDGANHLYYYYDANGSIGSISYNGVRYAFLKNLQGDVIAILDTSGNVVARYTYDAWGKVLSVTDANGNANTSSTFIGNVNPIRYRGYYYDTETGWYLTGTRYYDPMIGRFISADSVIPEPGSENAIVGSNMFAYCFNNPVNMNDQTGHWPKWLKAVATAVVAVAVVATVAAVTVASGGSAVPVIVGAAVGAVSSGAVDAATQYKNTGKVDICQTVVAASGGAVTGAVGGSGAGRIAQTVAGAATGAAQTKAKEVVTGKRASAAEYIVNTAAGGLAGLASGSGAQHIKQAPKGQITHYLSQSNFALFDKSLATKAALGSVVRGAGPGMLVEGAFTYGGDKLIGIFGN